MVFNSISGISIPNGQVSEVIRNSDGFVLWRGSFVLTFDANGGTLGGDEKTRLNVGDNYPIIYTPSRENHEFLGWTEERDGDEIIGVFGRCPFRCDTTVYAQWKRVWKITDGLSAHYKYHWPWNADHTDLSDHIGEVGPITGGSSGIGGFQDGDVGGQSTQSLPLSPYGVPTIKGAYFPEEKNQGTAYGYLEYADNDALSSIDRGDFSIACWIYPCSYPVSGNGLCSCCVIERSNSSQGSYGLEICKTEDSYRAGYVTLGTVTTDNISIDISKAPVNYSWSHVILVGELSGDNQKYTVYLDGKEVGSAVTEYNEVKPQNCKITVGKQFNGMISDLRIYGRALEEESRENVRKAILHTLYYDPCLSRYNECPQAGIISCSTHKTVGTNVRSTLTLSTNVGYEFNHWYYNGSQESSITFENISDDIYSPAMFQKLICVDFISCDLSTQIIGTQWVKKYQKAVKPSETVLKRKGYTFMTWSPAATYETVDVRHIASFQPNKYLLTFNANGGSCDVSSGFIRYDEEFGALPICRKYGCSHDGWTTLSDGNTVVSVYPSTVYQIEGDSVLSATYISNDYDVYLHLNGGQYGLTTKVLSDDCVCCSYTYGTGMILPRTSSQIYKYGYDFDGWYDDPELCGTYLSDSPSPPSVDYRISAISSTDFGDKSYWASWDPQEYTLCLDANGGYFKTSSGLCDMSSKTILFNMGYGNLPEPQRDKETYDYLNFDGWYTDRGIGYLVNSDTVKSDNRPITTIYAHWSRTPRQKVYVWSNPVAAATGSNKLRRAMASLGYSYSESGYGVTYGSTPSRPDKLSNPVSASVHYTGTNWFYSDSTTRGSYAFAYVAVLSVV